MGYSTYFDINAKVKTKAEANKLANAIDQIDELDRAECIKENKLWSVSAAGTARWYEWEDDLRVLSTEFPDVLIEVSGDGENNEDMWVAYFQNGKCQVCKAQITFEPYDPAKMT